MFQSKCKLAAGRIGLALGTFASGFLAILPTVANAQDILGNSGIQFNVDTIIEFEFIESNGAFQSTFGVVNLDTGEKFPLILEVKPADRFQDVDQPSDFQDDAGTSVKDFQGTPGNTVPQPFTEFEFKANTNYAFYLESTYNGRPAGILYSTDALNPNNNQQVMFEGGFETLGNNGATIRWDDTGIVKELAERDFDDFIIIAGGSLACPYDSNSENTQP
jgi:hypothetical protein